MVLIGYISNGQEIHFGPFLCWTKVTFLIINNIYLQSDNMQAIFKEIANHILL